MLHISQKKADPHANHHHLMGGNFWTDLAHPFVKIYHGDLNIKDIAQAAGEIVASPVLMAYGPTVALAAAATKHVLQDPDYGPAAAQVAGTTATAYAAGTLGPGGAAVAAGTIPIAMAVGHEITDSNSVKKAANYFSPF